MRLATSLATALLWLHTGVPALSQALPTGALIEGLLDKDGHAYEQAREELLGRRDLVDLSRESLEATTYRRSTWRRLVLTEALAMHLTHQEEAIRLRNLEGLDSGRYLRHRAPVPSAARELRRLRHVAPLMIELFLKGMETYDWSGPATAEREAATLRRDLLLAVAQSGHPASVHFLTDVVESGCSCCESCAAAVSALGETGALSTLPVLLRVMGEARRNSDVEGYATAVRALGGIPHAEVWPYIEAELNGPEPLVRVAAVRGAAAYGSAWHWRADAAQAARIRAVVGSSLVDALSQAEDEEQLVAVLESLGLVATPELRDLLEEIRAADSGTRRSTGSRTATPGRFQRALNRVNGTLAREQGLRERERQ